MLLRMVKKIMKDEREEQEVDEHSVNHLDEDRLDIDTDGVLLK